MQFYQEKKKLYAIPESPRPPSLCDPRISSLSTVYMLQNLKSFCNSFSAIPKSQCSVPTPSCRSSVKVQWRVSENLKKKSQFPLSVSPPACLKISIVFVSATPKSQNSVLAYLLSKHSKPTKENFGFSPFYSVMGGERCTVRVSNIPLTAIAQELFSFFESTIGPGSVFACEIFTERKNWKSRGFGRVQFETTDAANKAHLLSIQGKLEFQRAHLALSPSFEDVIFRPVDDRRRVVGGVLHADFMSGEDCMSVLES